MRTLNVVEMEAVSGGDPLNDAIVIFDRAWEVGGDIYKSLTVETQNLIGGTIDAALVNTGIKEFPEDVPVQETDGTAK